MMKLAQFIRRQANCACPCPIVTQLAEHIRDSFHHHIQLPPFSAQCSESGSVDTATHANVEC